MRRDPVMLQRIAESRASAFRTSIITRGELFYMAYDSDRVDENLALVRAFLAEIFVHRIDRETAEIYGRIKAHALARYGPRERAKAFLAPKPRLHRQRPLDRFHRPPARPDRRLER